MPELNQGYPALLESENKIKLLEPYRGAKKHHTMQCIVCEHVWEATPVSKRQTYKKYDVGGCPACPRENIQKARKRNTIRVQNMGIEVLSEWDGRMRTGNKPSELIQIKNTKCGHVSWVSPCNILTRNVTCPKCGIKERTANINALSKANSEQWQKTAPEWNVYKAKVSSLTRANYTKHKGQINPNNLLRERAGVEGAHHLDHIVPIRWCFDHNVPEELCAHPENLQMLGWRENVGSRDKLKDGVVIPEIIQRYLFSSLEWQICQDA